MLLLAWIGCTLDSETFQVRQGRAYCSGLQRCTPEHPLLEDGLASCRDRVADELAPPASCHTFDAEAASVCLNVLYSQACAYFPADRVYVPDECKVVYVEDEACGSPTPTGSDTAAPPEG